MREWVMAYDLPIITVVTKIDCISKNKVQSALAHVRKEFGGEIFRLVQSITGTTNQF